MKNVNIRLYKDKSTNELLISLSPVSSSLQDIVVSLLKGIMNEDAVVEEIVGLKEDKDVKKANNDTSFINKEEKEEITLTEYIMPSGPFAGMTPYDAIIQNTEKALPMFLHFCFKNKKNEACTTFSYYYDAVLRYLNELKENFSEKTEEDLDTVIRIFEEYNQEYTEKVKRSMQTDTLSALDIKKKIVLVLVDKMIVCLQS